MSSALRTSIAASALSVVFIFSRISCNEAASSGQWRSASWMATKPAVLSPEDTGDVASFIFAGTELERASSGISAGVQSVTVASGHGMVLRQKPPSDEASERIDPPASAWEASFSAGTTESKATVAMEESDMHAWVSDKASGAVVPSRMMQAEALLSSAEDAPADQWKAKTAERALRLYYHAKWLAERNYARAAEYRYQEAASLAKSCRRSVLASHSLARLGYFLMHWKRETEAMEVLKESMQLNVKSNPLAPYLHGVLERKVAVGDAERLRSAEDAILNSGEQPSEELEVERSRFIEEISFWRQAENESRHCLASSDAAYILICVCGHAVTFLRQVLFK